MSALRKPAKQLQDQTFRTAVKYGSKKIRTEINSVVLILTMEYSNKTILITGASSGIGAATALELAKYNNRMIITARREDLLKEIADKIVNLGSECLYLVGDATSEAHANKVIVEIIQKYGTIDIAILNIGHGPPSNLLTTSAKAIKFIMEANYHTFVNFYVPILQQMKKQKGKCMIAHMNSQATWFGIPMQGDYTAAKAAARIFVDTARMELQHFGIKHILLQTIHPGFVATKASKSDGIPVPNEISEEETAKYVLKGIKKGMNQNIFPLGTALAAKLGRILPRKLLTKILLSQTPPDY